MEKPICPKCKSTNVTLISYGLPCNIEAWQMAIEEGLIVPGGCVIGDNDPQWQCNNCPIAFGNREDPLEE